MILNLWTPTSSDSYNIKQAYGIIPGLSVPHNRHEITKVIHKFANPDGREMRGENRSLDRVTYCRDGYEYVVSSNI